MAARTHRIHLDVTFAERKHIAKLARKAGISTREFVRRADIVYCTAQEDEVLEKMLDLLNRSTARASAALDEALAFVEASNRRIEKMREAGSSRLRKWR